MEKVNTSLNIPPVGLGTVPLLQFGQSWLRSKNPFVRRAVWYMNIPYQIYQGYKLTETITDALQNGYRLIDTSRAYGVEKWIGKAISQSAVPRKDIFITTRISNQEQYSGRVREAVLNSLELLRTDYIDLYMLHWPVEEYFIESWKVLEEFYLQGKIKYLGVANFHQHHLKKLLDNITVKPVVNQFEIHPLFSQKKLVKFCHDHSIAVEAYTPLGRFDVRIAENPFLVSLGEKYNKTVAQIVLRWHIQNSIIPIPRSSRHQGLLENIDVFNFSLTEEDMIGIDNLNRDIRLRFNPDTADMRKL